MVYLHVEILSLLQDVEELEYLPMSFLWRQPSDVYLLLARLLGCHGPAGLRAACYGLAQRFSGPLAEPKCVVRRS